MACLRVSIPIRDETSRVGSSKNCWICWEFRNLEEPPLILKGIPSRNDSTWPFLFFNCTAPNCMVLGRDVVWHTQKHTFCWCMAMPLRINGACASVKEQHFSLTCPEKGRFCARSRGRVAVGYVIVIFFSLTYRVSVEFSHCSELTLKIAIARLSVAEEQIYSYLTISGVYFSSINIFCFS